MKRVAFLFAACLAGTTALAQPVEGKPPEAAFGWFGELVNACWVAKLNEKTEHRQCYTRQYDRFMRGQAALAVEGEGKMQTVFAGDSVYAWNAATKKIAYYIWGTDGSHRALEASYIGDELAFPIPLRADPRKTAYRSMWRRIDKDSFEVRRERADGDGWKEELKVTYRRVPKPSGETKEK